MKKQKDLQSLNRILALFLTLALGLPNSALALRTTNAGQEESHVRAALEEKLRPSNDPSLSTAAAGAEAIYVDHGKGFSSEVRGLLRDFGFKPNPEVLYDGTLQYTLDPSENHYDQFARIVMKEVFRTQSEAYYRDIPVGLVNIGSRLIRAISVLLERPKLKDNVSMAQILGRETGDSTYNLDLWPSTVGDSWEKLPAGSIVTTLTAERHSADLPEQLTLHRWLIADDRSEKRLEEETYISFEPVTGKLSFQFGHVAGAGVESGQIDLTRVRDPIAEVLASTQAPQHAALFQGTNVGPIAQRILTKVLAGTLTQDKLQEADRLLLALDKELSALQANIKGDPQKADQLQLLRRMSGKITVAGSALALLAAGVEGALFGDEIDAQPRGPAIRDPVELMNGAVVPHARVETTMLVLRLLEERDQESLYDLRMKSEKAGHNVPRGSADALQRKTLMRSDGTIHPDIQDIVLAAVKGDAPGHMSVVSPVAAGAEAILDPEDPQNDPSRRNLAKSVAITPPRAIPNISADPNYIIPYKMLHAKREVYRFGGYAGALVMDAQTQPLLHKALGRMEFLHEFKPFMIKKDGEIVSDIAGLPAKIGGGRMADSLDELTAWQTDGTEFMTRLKAQGYTLEEIDHRLIPPEELEVQMYLSGLTRPSKARPRPVIAYDYKSENFVEFFNLAGEVLLPEERWLRDEKLGNRRDETSPLHLTHGQWTAPISFSFFGISQDMDQRNPGSRARLTLHELDHVVMGVVPGYFEAARNDYETRLTPAEQTLVQDYLVAHGNYQLTDPAIFFKEYSAYCRNAGGQTTLLWGKLVATDPATYNNKPAYVKEALIRLQAAISDGKGGIKPEAAAWLEQTSQRLVNEVGKPYWDRFAETVAASQAKTGVEQGIEFPIEPDPLLPNRAHDIPLSKAEDTLDGYSLLPDEVKMRLRGLYRGPAYNIPHSIAEDTLEGYEVLWRPPQSAGAEGFLGEDSYDDPAEYGEPEEWGVPANAKEFGQGRIGHLLVIADDFFRDERMKPAVEQAVARNKSRVAVEQLTYMTDPDSAETYLRTHSSEVDAVLILGDRQGAYAQIIIGGNKSLPMIWLLNQNSFAFIGENEGDLSRARDLVKTFEDVLQEPRGGLLDAQMIDMENSDQVQEALDGALERLNLEAGYADNDQVILPERLAREFGRLVMGVERAPVLDALATVDGAPGIREQYNLPRHVRLVPPSPAAGAEAMPGAPTPNQSHLTLIKEALKTREGIVVLEDLVALGRKLSNLGLNEDLLMDQYNLPELVQERNRMRLDGEDRGRDRMIFLTSESGAYGLPTPAQLSARELAILILQATERSAGLRVRVDSKTRTMELPLDLRLLQDLIGADLSVLSGAKIVQINQEMDRLFQRARDGQPYRRDRMMAQGVHAAAELREPTLVRASDPIDIEKILVIRSETAAGAEAGFGSSVIKRIADYYRTRYPANGEARAAVIETLLADPVRWEPIILKADEDNADLLAILFYPQDAGTFATIPPGLLRTLKQSAIVALVSAENDLEEVGIAGIDAMTLNLATQDTVPFEAFLPDADTPSNIYDVLMAIHQRAQTAGLLTAAGAEASLGEVVTLSTGSVPATSLSSTTLLLKSLYGKDDESLYDLLMKCRDPQYDASRSAEALQRKNLMRQDGTIHPDTQKIVLAVLQGDSPDNVRLISPVAAGVETATSADAEWGVPADATEFGQGRIGHLLVITDDSFRNKRRESAVEQAVTRNGNHLAVERLSYMTDPEAAEAYLRAHSFEVDAVLIMGDSQGAYAQIIIRENKSLPIIWLLNENSFAFVGENAGDLRRADGLVKTFEDILREPMGGLLNVEMIDMDNSDQVQAALDRTLERLNLEVGYADNDQVILPTRLAREFGQLVMGIEREPVLDALASVEGAPGIREQYNLPRHVRLVAPSPAAGVEDIGLVRHVQIRREDTQALEIIRSNLQQNASAYDPEGIVTISSMLQHNHPDYLDGGEFYLVVREAYFVRYPQVRDHLLSLNQANAAQYVPPIDIGVEMTLVLHEALDRPEVKEVLAEVVGNALKAGNLQVAQNALLVAMKGGSAEEIAEQIAAGVEAKARAAQPETLKWLDAAADDPSLQELLGKPVIDLDLSVKALNAIEMLPNNMPFAGEVTIASLLTKTAKDIDDVRNVGLVTVGEIETQLGKAGLRLRRPMEPLPAAYALQAITLASREPAAAGRGIEISGADRREAALRLHKLFSETGKVTSETPLVGIGPDQAMSQAEALIALSVVMPQDRLSRIFVVTRNNKLAQSLTDSKFIAASDELVVAQRIGERFAGQPFSVQYHATQADETNLRRAFALMLDPGRLLNLQREDSPAGLQDLLRKLLAAFQGISTSEVAQDQLDQAVRDLQVVIAA